MTAEPLICDVKQHSLDDGPGIRTVVFFKGCTLRCAWCQNPETQSPKAELWFRAGKCIECSPCTVDCPEQAFLPGSPPGLNRESCAACFSCVDACPAGVVERAGKTWSIQGLVDMAKENKVFYDNSNGGFTLSGGEPLMHPAFLLELVPALKAEGISVVLETCGNVTMVPVVLEILSQVDLIYYDVKIFDPASHESFTGSRNDKILENLEKLVREDRVALPLTPAKPALRSRKDARPLLIPRVPLVPGATISQGNLDGIATMLSSLGVTVVDLLSYNPSWHEKSKALGLAITHGIERWITKEEKTLAADSFSNFTFDTFQA